MLFPAEFNLSDLDGSNGFVIRGRSFDGSGASVSNAGDVNGDGVDDLIIGALGRFRNFFLGEQSYVIFGGSGVGSTGTFDLSTLNGTNGFRVTDGQSGYSVSNAGDVNGDGVDDLIIGARDANKSYVVFGGSGIGSTGTIELSSLNGTNGFVLNPTNRFEFLGRSVSDAGDVNGDGVDDLIIAARNQSYVVFGDSGIGSTGTIELSSLNGTNGFVLNGIDTDDLSGGSVSSAGDINLDGIDDLIIGAPNADPNGDNSGQTYVVFGGRSVGSTGTIELSTLNGTNGFVLNGINPDDSLGGSVSNAGDINADGVDDLIIAATGADPNGSGSGQSYVVFGGRGVGSTGTIELSSLNGTNGFVLNGINPGDSSGYSVSNAGDVNGDGVDDLIIGNPNAGFQSGQNYVVFGGSGIGSTGTIELSTLNATNGFVLNGINRGDSSGYSVSNAGDINGDGVDDLIIGNPNAGFQSGQNYVVFGGSGIGSTGTIELSTLNATNGFVLNGINRGDSSGYSVSNAGDINGDGVDDLIIGNPNAGFQSGQSYVVFGRRDNTAPDAVDDTVVTDEDNALTGSVFADNGNGADNDPDGNIFTVTEVNGIAANVNNQITLASGALLTLNSDGNFEYDPNGQFESLNDGETAIDTFTYTIDNGNGGTDTATVSVTINGNRRTFPAEFNLSDLDGTNGFVINGIGVVDRLGASVSNAGDVNGDGVDDLIIGTLGGYRTLPPSEESYVIFGGSGIGSTGTFDLSTLNGTNGFVLNGINLGDFSGYSLSNAGDVNGDGVDDLIIGARGTNESYVVFGGSGIGSTGTIELSTLNGTNGFVLNGSTSSVSNAGDVNGDGVDDLIIGASGAGPNGSGQTYVVFGGSGIGSSGTIELSTLNGTNGFVLNGINPFDRSGRSVSNAGDVNGDGVDDLIIGASSADPNGDSSGQTYVVFGGRGVGSTGTIELSTLNGTNGFVLNGINPDDNSGDSVSNAGDVNDDGVEDLIIGASSADPNGDRSGQSYVVFGGSGIGSTGTIELSSLNGTNGFVLNGINTFDGSGRSVSNAGDVNGDEVDDLIIAAGNQKYVVFGGRGVGSTGTIELSSLNGINGFILNGSGSSVSNAGDVNGDGVDDLIIGSRFAGFQSGQTYIVFGIRNNTAPDAVDDTVTTDEDNALSGSVFADNGNGADNDPEGGIFTVTEVNGNASDVNNQITLASGALLTLNSDGTFDYDPNGQFESLNDTETAIDSFTYTIDDGNGGTDTATVSVTINGTGRRFPAEFNLSDLDGSNGFIIDGAGSFDRSGGSVSNAGDVNGDGVDDFIIGAVGRYRNSFLDEESYVIFGGSGVGSSGTIELSSLNGTNGFVATNGESGYSVSNAGDVNGDGVDDLIIGALFANQSYVVFGGSGIGSTGTIELSSLNGTNGFVLNPINQFDFLGRSVSNAGDVNGDGVDDLIIGATGAGPNRSGQTYVVFGGSGIGSTGTIELSTLNGTNGFVLNGSGSSVSNAGDVNGDGVDDLIIGAPNADPNGDNSGQTYVVFGGRSVGSTGTIELSTLNGTNGFVLNGIDPRDRSGSSVSNAGDVNADGVDDLIIRAGNQNYVVFGGSGIGSSGTIELSTLNGTNGFVLNGSTSSVSNAGDVNGDGVDDLIIGASGAGSNGSGQTYVVFGGSGIGSTGTIELSTLKDTNGFVLNGINRGDSSGRSVSNAGDVNGDGVDDLIIGAPFADPNGSYSGQSYVVFGIKENTVPDAVDDTVTTDEDNALSGSVFADNGNGADNDPDGDIFTVTEVNGNAADVNNQITLASGALLTLNSDGTFDYDPNGQFESLNDTETAIDSFTYTIDDGNGGTDTATVSVTINGITPPNEINGTTKSDKLIGTPGRDLIRGINGDDTLEGRGGDDTIEGGRGGDIIRGGAGNDVLAADRVDRYYDFDGTFSELRGGRGNDTIFGGRKHDEIGGGQDNDVLFGKRGDDLIRGGKGDDILNGGLGNDTLRGQDGIDTADYSDLTFNGVLATVAGLDVNLSQRGAQHSSNNSPLKWNDTLTTIENVIGTSRNDRFIGNAEDNLFDGKQQVNRNNRQTKFTDLDGHEYQVNGDVVEYSGNQSHFTILGSTDNFTVNGSDIGTDTLIDIEFLKFDDGLFAVDDSLFA